MSRQKINQHEVKEKASHVLDIIRKFKIMPISVQQRVLAIHPKTKELRTAKILTAGSCFTDEKSVTFGDLGNTGNI